MKFGIITPVYEKCLDSIELLYEDLKRQTHKDWIWFLCSNGISKKFSEFVERKNRTDENHRIVYLSTSYSDQSNCFSLIANIGKRRNLCIKKIDCDYIFMFDADAKLLDKQMFQIISEELRKRPTKVCVYHIMHEEHGVLPKFPININRIDLLNFCVQKGLARKIGYPTTVDFYMRANDFNFFVRAYKACDGDAMLLQNVFCEYNGNNRYKNILKNLKEMDNKKYSDLKYYLIYGIKHHPLGLLKTIKDYPFSINILPFRVVFERDLFYKNKES